ncbi:hypothetical protein DL765_008591 [Monosporascus sp. GIB2]|nr:hypothetical protein DL765_008591 [Monosporascus sp. GIB2]
MAEDALQHPPFSLAQQLNRDAMAALALRHNIADTDDGWDDCLASDLQTKILDDLYPYLWLVARKEAAHIDSLHEHLIHKRTIVPAEEPKLHLVRYYETVYIKPLPDYLFNRSIWQQHIHKVDPQPVRGRAPGQARYNKYRTAVGFLRSYSFLIRHESDFIIAQKANLLPKYISFQRFQSFIQPFRLIADDYVSHRYQYGQFRLTRLNWAVRITSIIWSINAGSNSWQLAWNYQPLFWQSSQYLQHYTAPLLFLFVVLSLILSAMQVVLAALAADPRETFVRVSRGFSVATIILATCSLAGILIGLCAILLIQGRFAVTKKWA